MASKVTVSTKIRVNGQAYANADAMPPAIRQLYERALASIDGGTYKGPLSIFIAKSALKGDGNVGVEHVASRVSSPPTGGQAMSNTRNLSDLEARSDQRERAIERTPAAGPRIVFNGEEYASVEAMPTETRRAYEGVLAMLAADRSTPAGTGPTNQAVHLDDEAIRSILAASPARPESTTWRLVIAGAVVAAMLLAGFMFGR
jgi:hypothetical protein